MIVCKHHQNVGLPGQLQECRSGDSRLKQRTAGCSGHRFKPNGMRRQAQDDQASTTRYTLIRFIVLIIRLLTTVILGVLGSAFAAEDDPGQPEPGAAEPAAGLTAESTDPEDRRAQLNLLGQTDIEAGESRRNENIQFNLIDNNALKELNVRLGTTATIVDDFRADQNYFGSEFGTSPAAAIHLTAWMCLETTLMAGSSTVT